MKRKKTFYALSAAFLATSIHMGCESTPAKVPIEQQQRVVLAINPSNEMSKGDAEKIMKLYLRVCTFDCNEVTEMKDEGEYWVAAPILGSTWNQKQKDPIRLNKSTGAITWNYGPSYPSLPSLVDASKKETLH